MAVWGPERRWGRSILTTPLAPTSTPRPGPSCRGVLAELPHTTGFQTGHPDRRVLGYVNMLVPWSGLGTSWAVFLRVSGAVFLIPDSLRPSQVLGPESSWVSGPNDAKSRGTGLRTRWRRSGERFALRGVRWSMSLLRTHGVTTRWTSRSVSLMFSSTWTSIRPHFWTSHWWF